MQTIFSTTYFWSNVGWIQGCRTLGGEGPLGFLLRPQTAKLGKIGVFSFSFFSLSFYCMGIDTRLYPCSAHTLSLNCIPASEIDVFSCPVQTGVVREFPRVWTLVWDKQKSLHPLCGRTVWGRQGVLSHWCFIFTTFLLGWLFSVSVEMSLNISFRKPNISVSALWIFYEENLCQRFY